jgi:DNA polymerase III subunit delta
MATWHPAYLIHGDDHGRVAERRANFRAGAEADAEAATGGLEVLEGDAADPEAVAGALSAMTFAIGRRFIIVDGVERWKDAEVAPLGAVLKDPPPETTVAFFAREEGRTVAPKALHRAVGDAGGRVVPAMMVKAWELPKWVAGEARRMGLTLEQGAAKALVQQVGDRQQRLLRELEKLELDLGEGATITSEDIERLTASSAQSKRWALGDALLAGDAPAASRLYLELRGQGERLAGLTYAMTARLRDALGVVTRIDAGEPAGEIRRTLRMPPKAAQKFLADAQRLDRDRLRAAVEVLADLEYESRGGGAPMHEDTAAQRAIVKVAGPRGAGS